MFCLWPYFEYSASLINLGRKGAEGIYFGLRLIYLNSLIMWVFVSVLQLTYKVDAGPISLEQGTQRPLQLSICLQLVRTKEILQKNMKS